MEFMRQATRQAKIELDERAEGVSRFPATISTETPVRRRDYTRGEFDEVLSHKADAVDLSRAPLPLIESHDSTKVNVGVVNGLRLEGSKLRGTLVLGTSQRAQELADDIAAGIVTGLSVGYQIADDEFDPDTATQTVTRWIPYEVSIVSVPADINAGIGRSAKMDPSSEQIRAADAVRAADEQRSKDIRALVTRAKLDSTTADHLIKSGASLDAARTAVIDALAQRDEATAIDGHLPEGAYYGRFQAGQTEHEKFIEGASAWLLSKNGGGVVQRAVERKIPGFEKVSLDPAEFRGLTMLDLARESLERRGVRTRGWDRTKVASQALVFRSGGQQTTSDFSVLLENILSKQLLGAYKLTPDKWKSICRTDTVSDFRTAKRYRTGSFGSLDLVLEGSEFKYKAAPDGASFSISAQTKGNLISISRATLINDDMGAVLDTASKLGRAAALSIEMDVFAMLNQNGGLGPTMGDSNPFFHSAHKNVNGSPAALTADGLDSDRVIMASQTDPSGNELLDLKPQTLLVPIGLGGQARVINGAKYDPTAGTAFEKPNLVYGLFENVVDTARLSGTRRYLFADPGVAPTMVVAFLAESGDAPFLEQRLGWSTDGTDWKVRLDYGVSMGEYVGAVTNAGS